MLSATPSSDALNAEPTIQYVPSGVSLKGRDEMSMTEQVFATQMARLLNEPVNVTFYFLNSDCFSN
jgi:sorbitol-specific phosphotransferase system component IIBC